MRLEFTVNPIYSDLHFLDIRLPNRQSSRLELVSPVLFALGTAYTNQRQAQLPVKHRRRVLLGCSASVPVLPIGVKDLCPWIFSEVYGCRVHCPEVIAHVPLPV